jgi:hypothetical protein
MTKAFAGVAVAALFAGNSGRSSLGAEDTVTPQAPPQLIVETMQACLTTFVKDNRETGQVKEGDVRCGGTLVEGMPPVFRFVAGPESPRHHAESIAFESDPNGDWRTVVHAYGEDKKLYTVVVDKDGAVDWGYASSNPTAQRGIKNVLDTANRMRNIFLDALER